VNYVAFSSLQARCNGVGLSYLRRGYENEKGAEGIPKKGFKKASDLRKKPRKS